MPSLPTEVTIYTDGACSGNPGPGGWGAILLHPSSGKELRLSGGAEHTTNNRMELCAALEALRRLKRATSVTLYSDSKYLVQAFREGWLAKWQRNGWLTSQKKPVENVDLWRQLVELTKLHKVHWEYVPGHSNYLYNELCDQLARAEVQKIKEGKGS